MTNAELIAKIKAEIERRLKDYWEISFHDTNSYNQDTNVKELKELLSFLSTLESEKPMIPQKELEAAEKYVSTLCDRVDEGLRIDTTLESAFIAGYNLCKEQIMKEAVEGEVLDLGINYLDLSLFDAEKIGIKEGDKVRVMNDED